MSPVSQRCFGPYESTPATAPWMGRFQVLHRCANPAHPPHLVDTRTGAVVQCDEAFRVSRVDIRIVQSLTGGRYRERCSHLGGRNPTHFYTCSKGHLHLLQHVVG